MAADWTQVNPEVTSLLADASSDELQLLEHIFGSDMGTPMLILWCTCMGVATIFFLLRMGVRLFGPIGLRMDDWLLILSYITAVTAFVLAVIEYRLFYLGRGLEPMLFHAHPTAMLKALYVQIILYIVSISFSKFSFLGLYWLLLSGVDRMRWYLIAATVYIVVGSIGLIFWKCFACIPIELNWIVRLSSVPGEVSASDKCRVAVFTALYGTYGFTIVADGIMILLSLPLLRSLRLPMREKVGIFAMFALTFLSVIAATARVVVSAITQDIVVMMGAAGIEMALCVIIVSIPALRTLIRMKKSWCQEEKGLPKKPSKRNMRANRERIEAAVAASLDDYSGIRPMSPTNTGRRGSERSIGGWSLRSARSARSEKQSRSHVEEVAMYEHPVITHPMAYQRLRQQSLHSESEGIEIPTRINSTIHEEVPPRVHSIRTESEFDEFDFQLPFPYKPSPLTSPDSTKLCHSRSPSTTSMC